jgi:acyl-CoA reductase-like NAD-dependent aldehyde dehydrogenase
MIFIYQLLLQQSASTVKRVCLELGGNAPLIVFASADIAKAVAVSNYIYLN